jgi:ribosomal protein S18 acetylase RimI-like enzyme
MPLRIRPALASDYAAIETMVIESFEPITWQKRLDDAIGPLNGCDWRERWRIRLANIFKSQVVLIGEQGDALAAIATATIDAHAALAFLDVLAVAREFQSRGLGREMLRGAIEHYRSLGCKYVNLDCLTDNDAGNRLYESEGFQEVARHIRWFKQI